VSTLQCPIGGVKHRKEYPGGEQAYLASIPQNLYLVEVPIDTSIFLMSGKYKRLKTRLNYKAISAQINGLLVDETQNCDDCTASVTRLTINKTQQKEIDYPACQKEGVYDSSLPLDSELLYESSEKNLSGFIACPNGAIQIEEIIQSLQEDGQSSYVVQMTIQQTGYAKKPFYHDYILGVNKQKGSGAQATFRIGNFQYKCDYKLESEYSNGFADPPPCGLTIFQENAYDFDATFEK
jgi:hypothetical protein